MTALVTLTVLALSLAAALYGLLSERQRHSRTRAELRQAEGALHLLAVEREVRGRA